MIWRDLKNLLEEKGITDETDIQYIDIHCNGYVKDDIVIKQIPKSESYGIYS